MTPPWQDDHIEKLKALYATGKSAAQIARSLNSAFPDAAYTRNAVIGKLGRIGLTLSRDRPSAPAKGRPPKPPPAQAPASRATRPKVSITQYGAVFEPAPSQPLEERSEPTGLVTPLTLGPRMCKWPIGDPALDSFTHCGRRRPGEGPYCEEHATVAYQPPKPRQPRTGNELARSLRRFL